MASTALGEKGRGWLNPTYGLKTGSGFSQIIDDVEPHELRPNQRFAAI